MDLKILYKSENVIVIYKPKFLSVQSDASGSPNAMSMTQQLLIKAGEREELFLINRLDNVVSGLVVFARNKKTATMISKMLSDDDVVKEYLAVVDGISTGGKMTDYLKKDTMLSKALKAEKDDPSAKLAILDSELIETVKLKNADKSLLKIRLKTGRFHQIRAQFSLRGTPLCGDKKYSSKDFFARGPALIAYHICFSIDNEEVDVTCMPNVDDYPWNLFSASKYQKIARKSYD